MVYGFAKQSGGHVGIESKAGCGTTVTLYLPCASAESVALTDPDVVEGTVTPVGHETILAVEDDRDVREHVVDVLRGLGYRVLEAATAREALAVLEGGEHPDLLYTDVVLPGGVDGGELARRALVLQPTLRVLFTSGYTASVPMPEGPLVQKPYSKDSLARAVRDALEPDVSASPS
jgi:CheY-like chemotaxis protein